MKTGMLRPAIVLFGALLLLSFSVSPQSKNKGSAAPAKSATRTYSVVASESSFWIFVGKTGLLSGLAHNHEIGVKFFTGRVVIPEAGAGAATLELDVDAKSLAVLDKEVSDKDRTEIYNSMHTAVLESAKHPKITFRSASVTDVKEAGAGSYSFTLNGDLALHGVTRRIAVPVTATITPQQIKASGKYTLRQTDYGITPYSAAGGTIKVKNEVVVNFAIVAKAA
ncbi:MAG TPA: YceI family protein [Blastocatellia bacterium]|nr:YceI family protein [Blastocatellia bacterium]